MKTLKKILTILLVAVFCISCFVACQKNDDDKTEPETSGQSENQTDGSDDIDQSLITIERALELCGEEGNVTEERYYIKAKIDSIDNAQYGQMTISDDTGSISVYRTDNFDGTVNYSEMESKPYKGDTVLLLCVLQNYNGTKEIKYARLVEFWSNQADVDTESYVKMTIAQAREATAGEKVRVSGVVARITYANGMKPSGFYLVDDTQSIYVYDADLAQRVEVGNSVDILGSKTYWILEDEKSNAEKFDYKGCCQLSDVTLVELDNSKKDYSKEWIKESTVKDVLETSVTENVTSTIYKVNALVKKEIGQGFINYYFYDIDGKTSSYAYTQCNGKDFAWLDEFDGKICTVYLSPLNAKSTASDCYFRFVPVDVTYNNYKFDISGVCEYAVKYHIAKQFDITEYSADPALKLITSVSSELLGFDGVSVKYSSSDESVVYFAKDGDNTVMHCKNSGNATVSVDVNYKDITLSVSYQITVTLANNIDYISVGEAIKAQKDETVIVKGVVGASLINKTGFYLIDESGIIAVQASDDIMKTVNIGDEIIISAKRAIQIKEDKKDSCFGQSYLDMTDKEATVLANNYGNHKYSTASFDSTKSIKDIYELDIKTDYTTTAYIVSGKISVNKTQYSTTYSIVGDDGTSIQLYSGSASQYEWLFDYADQELTIEMTVCNWNSKVYKGSVLAITTSGGEKIVNEYNFQGRE